MEGINKSNEDKFISDLKDMRVEIDLMNKYDINKKSPNQLIIGYTSITNDKIIEGLNILIGIIKKNKWRFKIVIFSLVDWIIDEIL